MSSCLCITDNISKLVMDSCYQYCLYINNIMTKIMSIMTNNLYITNNK